MNTFKVDHPLAKACPVECRHYYDAQIAKCCSAESFGNRNQREARRVSSRSRAINAPIEQVAKVFNDREADLVAGAFDEDLVARMQRASALAAFRSLGSAKVYRSRPVLEIEAPGFSVLGNLLEAFISALGDIATNGNGASGRAKTMFALTPTQFLGANGAPDSDPYQRVLKVTDYVSGMTDGFAVDLFRRICGMELRS